MYIYFIYDKFIYACVCNDIAVGKFFVSFGLSSNVKKKSIIISKDFVTGNRIHTYSIFTKWRIILQMGSEICDTFTYLIVSW